jgi:pantoate--beta-alanine ligase
MQIITTAADMQQRARALQREGQRIGFVPTMGYLHEGHLSLVRLAREHSDIAVVSIFVNPAQFGPHEDLEAYPRDFERDEALCREENTGIVFYPPVEQMYAPDASVFVDENRLSNGLCGRSRPGHFRGVLTVVCKLFNLVMPDVAVFGQKDAQQLRVIQQMTRDLHFPTKIIAGPIVREADGLAMSSRNAYLTPAERPQAPCLRRALDAAETLFEQGERNVEPIRRNMQEIIDAQPDAQIDYIEVADWQTLSPVQEIQGPTLVALAVQIGRTRLIDNTLIACK